jgi:hypothetical protein
VDVSALANWKQRLISLVWILLPFLSYGLYLTLFDGDVLEGMPPAPPIVYVPFAFLTAFLDLIVNKWLLLILYYGLSWVAVFVGYYFYNKRKQRVRTLPQET